MRLLSCGNYEPLLRCSQAGVESSRVLSQAGPRSRSTVQVAQKRLAFSSYCSDWQ